MYVCMYVCMYVRAHTWAYIWVWLWLDLGWVVLQSSLTPIHFTGTDAHLFGSYIFMWNICNWRILGCTSVRYLKMVEYHPKISRKIKLSNSSEKTHGFSEPDITGDGNSMVFVAFFLLGPQAMVMFIASPRILSLWWSSCEKNHRKNHRRPAMFIHRSDLEKWFFHDFYPSSIIFFHDFKWRKPSAAAISASNKSVVQVSAAIRMGWCLTIPLSCSPLGKLALVVGNC